MPRRSRLPRACPLCACALFATFSISETVVAVCWVFVRGTDLRQVSAHLRNQVLLLRAVWVRTGLQLNLKATGT